MQSVETTVKMTLQKHKGTIVLWMSCPLLVFAIYHLFSDGDFSFLLTAGSIVRGFAFFLLTFRILSQRSARDLSQKTLIAYVKVFFARLVSVLWQQGYLPFDKSGDFVYQGCEIFSLVMALTALYLTTFQFRDNYNGDADNFASFMPKYTGVAVIALPTFILALLVHPHLNNFFVTDAAWAYACYLETFAVVPQLVMMKKNGKGDTVIVEPYTAHWIFSLALARFCHFVFWIFSYHELNSEEADAGFVGGIVGWIVLIFQVLQLVIMMDYIYFYLRSAARGEAMKLPVRLSLV